MIFFNSSNFISISFDIEIKLALGCLITAIKTLSLPLALTFMYSFASSIATLAIFLSTIIPLPLLLTTKFSMSDLVAI